MTQVAHRRSRSPAAGAVDGLLAASRALVALSARSVAQLDVDVTLVQYRALVVLATRGPQRAADLAEELGVASSTVTRMCDRLYRKGLIRRYRRGDDRRATWVALTEAGRDLVGEVMRHRRDAIAKLVRSMPIEDARALADGLHAFVEAAGEIPDAEWWRRWRVCAAPDPAAVEG